ncbi:MAG: hypothetical protein ABIE84_03470 [bacterium]
MSAVSRVIIWSPKVGEGRASTTKMMGHPFQRMSNTLKPFPLKAGFKQFLIPLLSVFPLQEIRCDVLGQRLLDQVLSKFDLSDLSPGEVVMEPMKLIEALEEAVLGLAEHSAGTTQARFIVVERYDVQKDVTDKILVFVAALHNISTVDRYLAEVRDAEVVELDLTEVGADVSLEHALYLDSVDKTRDVRSQWQHPGNYPKD